MSHHKHQRGCAGRSLPEWADLLVEIKFYPNPIRVYRTASVRNNILKTKNVLAIFLCCYPHRTEYEFDKKPVSLSCNFLCMFDKHVHVHCPLIFIWKMDARNTTLLASEFALLHSYTDKILYKPFSFGKNQLASLRLSFLMEIQYVVLDKLVPVRIYLRQPIHPIHRRISNPTHLQIGMVKRGNDKFSLISRNIQLWCWYGVPHHWNRKRMCIALPCCVHQPLYLLIYTQLDEWCTLVCGLW